MHLLEVAVDFVANDAQHIVIEDGSIHSTHHKGLIGLILHAAQSLTKSRRQPGCLDVDTDTIVHDINPMEHRLIHGLENLVRSSLIVLPDLCHGRLQGVGRDFHHRLSAQQFGLQQLTVGFIFRRLLDNLLQHVVGGLRQVFLLCLRHFLP